jgi:hypothetical protein
MAKKNKIPLPMNHALMEEGPHRYFPTQKQSRMKAGGAVSRREMEENTLTPMKTIDAKPIETNTPTRSVQNISVDEAMKTGSWMNQLNVQPNMSKQEIREENKYLKQSEKGTWDKNVAKETKKSKIKQAKQEFKSKYPFGASKSIVNGETSQMKEAQGIQPSPQPTKLMSDIEKMVNRRGY